jgi:hypothetical protein
MSSRTSDPEVARAAVELLRGKRGQHVAEASRLAKRRRELLAELGQVERELAAAEARVEALQSLEHEVARDTPANWRGMDVPTATQALLDEAGGYLTNQQIRRGLAQHGVSVDDTSSLCANLMDAARSGAPLLPLSNDLWAKAEWVDQARFSLPQLYPDIHRRMKQS